jgi:hypothetical protein
VTKKWREEYVNSKWLNINEDLAYRKIINCTKVNKINSLGKYVFNTKCKWKDKVRGNTTPPPLRVAGNQNTKLEILLRVEIAVVQ